LYWGQIQGYKKEEKKCKLQTYSVALGIAIFYYNILAAVNLP
jgi:hypothetical protein